jgi:DMSO/TMAO reductase YedYZ molybdopterin-dependent catalytic subunit
MMQIAAVVSLLIVTLPLAAQSPQHTIEVRLTDGSARQIAFAGLAIHQVPVQENGLKRMYEGVLLRDVLASAGIQLGEHLRGAAMRRYVVAVGQDGYRVVIALPELDAGFTDQNVVIATGHDGHGLIPDHGPLRLVVPRDKRAARWVRQLVRLELHDAP